MINWHNDSFQGIYSWKRLKEANEDTQGINRAVPVGNVLDQKLVGQTSALSYMNTFCNIDSKKMFWILKL